MAVSSCVKQRLQLVQGHIDSLPVELRQLAHSPYVWEQFVQTYEDADYGWMVRPGLKLGIRRTVFFVKRNSGGHFFDEANRLGNERRFIALVTCRFRRHRIR